MDYNSKIVMLKGADGTGIKDIQKTGSSGLQDTYTITLSDGQKHNFDVTNGKGISSIAKTGTNGLVDTYTITLTNGENFSFNVTNGMNADGREVLRSLPNISIPANADMNTAEYLNIGSYFCSLTDTAQTVSNIPVKTAFCMYVIAIIGGSYGSESSTQWINRMRIFIPYNGDIYVQFVNSGETPGVFNYLDWKRLISSDQLIAITNSDIDTILNS